MINIFLKQDEHTHDINMILETEFDGKKYGVGRACQNDLREFMMTLQHATDVLERGIKDEREKHENATRDCTG